MTINDNNRYGRDGILLQIAELERRKKNAVSRRIWLTSLTDQLRDKFSAIRNRLKKLINQPEGPPTGDPEYKKLFVDEANLNATLARKEQELKDVLHLIKQLEFEIEALNKGEQAASTEAQSDQKSELATSISGDEIILASPERGKKAPTTPTDPLDRSIFGEATTNSALQPKAPKLDGADNSSKLSELTPFESVFEQLQPEEKSLDETLYPKMTSQRDAEGLVRRRKDGQPKSMAENLFPSNFPEDDYDLVEIASIKPAAPWDESRFTPDGMRRKGKKKLF